MDEARRKSAAKDNTERGKNGIIHAMRPHAKTALSLAFAIVGGIAAGMRCDAFVTVETSSQFNPHPAAYTVKAYTDKSDPFVPGLFRNCGKEKECNRKVALLKQRFSTRCNRMAVSDAVCVI